jgi:hypothetical protein
MKYKTALNRLDLLKRFNEIVVEQKVLYKDAYAILAKEVDRPIQAVTKDVQRAKRHEKQYTKFVNYHSKLINKG